MSLVRDKLREWLVQLEVSGRVFDVGGIACPMRNQVKDVGITEYKILDIKDERKEVKTDYIVDLNNPIDGKVPNYLYYSADFIFCTEVMQFVYKPFEVLRNIYRLMADDGILYITFHLNHPPMKGTDYLRYTKKGIERLLKETGFKIEYIKEPIKGYGYYQVKATCQP